jgi:hypothetical protein
MKKTIAATIVAIAAAVSFAAPASAHPHFNRHWEIFHATDPSYLISIGYQCHATPHQFYPYFCRKEVPKGAFEWSHGRH